MAPRGKIVRSTAAQINRLVDYMSTNKLFACGEFSGPLGVQRAEAEWAEVKRLLAEHGPDKTVDQWKHTWRDLKKKAREEAGRARLTRNRTGNAVPVPELAENCKKILATIGEECATGIGVEQETGIGVGSIDISLATRSTQASVEEPFEFQFLPSEEEIETLEAEPPQMPRGRAPRPPGGTRPARRRTTTTTQQHTAAFVRAQQRTNRVLEDIAVEMRLAARHRKRDIKGGVHFLKF